MVLKTVHLPFVCTKFIFFLHLLCSNSNTKLNADVTFDIYWQVTFIFICFSAFQ